MSETPPAIVCAMKTCKLCGSTSNGFYGARTLCKECDKARSQRYREANREKVLAAAREYSARNKDKKKAWRDANRETHIAYHRRWRYGITREQFEAMRDAQCGLCAICGIDPSTVAESKWRALCVDHCHKSGRVRSLLCHGCNRALGFIRENPAIAEAMRGYLERYQH